MKVLVQNDISPIHILPGDKVQVIYHRPRWRTTKKLVEHVVTETCMVDRVAVVEMAQDELGELGMSQALAGVLGKREE